MSILEAIEKYKIESKAWREQQQRVAAETEYFKQLKVRETLCMIEVSLSEMKYIPISDIGFDVAVGSHVVSIRVRGRLLTSASPSYGAVVKIRSLDHMCNTQPEYFVDAFARFVVRHGLVN